MGDCGHTEVQSLVMGFPYPPKHSKTHLLFEKFPKYPLLVSQKSTQVLVTGSAYCVLDVQELTHFLFPSFISYPK